jgi:hypothetical protein
MGTKISGVFSTSLRPTQIDLMFVFPLDSASVSRQFSGAAAFVRLAATTWASKQMLWVLKRAAVAGRRGRSNPVVRKFH